MASNPAPSPIDWSKIRVLSFDVYGTLIGTEGQYAVLRASPLAPYLLAPTQDEALAPFESYRTAIEAKHPHMKQSEISAETVRRFAADNDLVPLKVSKPHVEQTTIAMAKSVGEYEPFPDSIKAMRRLGSRFKLAALSNVDRESFAALCFGPLKDVHWDAEYIAEDIGSYKPDLRNFEYLFRSCERVFDTIKTQGVHVANSIQHDHIPAKQINYTSVWIDRQNGLGKDGRGEKEHSAEFGYEIRFETLGQLADHIDSVLRAS